MVVTDPAVVRVEGVLTLGAGTLTQADLCRNLTGGVTRTGDATNVYAA